MKNCTLFQCIPAYKPSPTVRLIQRLTNFNCNILLDLEDSIQDLIDAKNTRDLKANARKSVLAIAAQLPETSFYIRINKPGTEESYRDYELLNQIENQVHGVFIPKVEDYNSIAQFLKYCSSNFKICIIIESPTGLNNLDSILNQLPKGILEYVFFGNYDYHLSSGVYPIPEQSSNTYWEIAKKIISISEKHKYAFGNSPYTALNDEATLNFLYNQLMQNCSLPFALMSLHFSQTKYFFNLSDKQHSHELPFLGCAEEPLTTNLYLNNLQKGRSFAFFANRIITPQEYLLLNRRQNEK